MGRDNPTGRSSTARNAFLGSHGSDFFPRENKTLNFSVYLVTNYRQSCVSRTCQASISLDSRGIDFLFFLPSFFSASQFKFFFSSLTLHRLYQTTDSECDERCISRIIRPVSSLGFFSPHGFRGNSSWERCLPRLPSLPHSSFYLP